MTRPQTIALFGLALLPLCAIPGFLFRDSWEIVGVYAGCAAFTLWLKSWWLRAFMIAAMIALVRHPTMGSLSGMAMIVIFLGAANVYLVVPARDIVASIQITGLSMAAIVLFQVMGVIPKYSGEPTGYFNPDAAGVFFAICFPAFLRGRWRYVAPLIAGCVILSGTTTGFASLAAASAVFATLWRPRMSLYALSGIAALGAAWGLWIDPFVHTLNNPRWIAWKHILLTFRSEMFGRGIGSFRETFNFFILSDPNLPHNWPCAHNEFLQTGYEMGIQAVILIGVFLAVFAARTWKNRAGLTTGQMQVAAGVAAVAVSCMGWFTFHIAPLALVSLAWIALWISGQKVEKVRNAEGGKVRMSCIE